MNSRTTGNATLGVEQRHAHLAQRGVDIGFAQRAATAQAVETSPSFLLKPSNIDLAASRPFAQTDYAPMREHSRIGGAPPAWAGADRENCFPIGRAGVYARDAP